MTISTPGGKTPSKQTITADVTFQGATRRTEFHVIDNTSNSEVVEVCLLGTDVTCPRGNKEDQWEKTRAKSEKANGILSALDVDGKYVHITHTFPSWKQASRIANRLAHDHISSGTEIPLYLVKTRGELYPRIRANDSFRTILKNQMWSVGPSGSEDRFIVDGNRLRSGLTWQRERTEDQPERDHIGGVPWGYATPIIALEQEEAEASGADRHITAYHVNKADVTASESQTGTPSASRATTEGSNIPRTKIIELTQEEIESRGLRKKADEAQQKRSEYWAREAATNMAFPQNKAQ